MRRPYVSARSEERSDEPRSRERKAGSVSARSEERSDEPRSRERKANSVSARSEERSDEPRSRERKAGSVNELDFEGWTCPVPLRDTPYIVMGHGGGGAMSAELVQHLFLPGFGAAAGGDLADAAVLPPGAGRIAMSTDSFVVKPMFFPGGSIGDLAVNGTVNDLAMAGAVPRYLSA